MVLVRNLGGDNITSHGPVPRVKPLTFERALLGLRGWPWCRFGIGDNRDAWLPGWQMK